MKKPKPTFSDPDYPLYKTEAEIAALVGVSTTTWRKVAKALKPKGLPSRDPMFANKRYWPAVRRFLDRRAGLSSGSDRPDRPTEPIARPAPQRSQREWQAERERRKNEEHKADIDNVTLFAKRKGYVLEKIESKGRRERWRLVDASHEVKLANGSLLDAYNFVKRKPYVFENPQARLEHFKILRTWTEEDFKELQELQKVLKERQEAEVGMAPPDSQKPAEEI